MKHHVRIIGDEPPRSFADLLVERARTIVEARSGEGDDLTHAVTAELALTLCELDQLRELDRSLARSLLRVECYTNTELIHMEQRTPRYSPYRFPEREKFQRRLHEIERERRTTAVQSIERTQKLEERLLDIMTRHFLASQSWKSKRSSER